MPRGRVSGPQTIDEKIDRIKRKIDEKAEELASLKTELKSLEKQKESEDLQKLYSAIKNANLTVDEFLEKLK